MGKNAYSSEIKWAVVKDKMSGELTNKEIMEKYGIKNISQIKRWMVWHGIVQTKFIFLINRLASNIHTDMVRNLKVKQRSKITKWLI